MNQQTLCAAIRERKNVLIKYDDDVIERTFSPYIVYTSSKDNETVAGYQVANPAEPLERDKWRMLTIAKISSVRLGATTFTVNQSFNPADKVYGHRIVCHVKQYV